MKRAHEDKEDRARTRVRVDPPDELCSLREYWVRIQQKAISLDEVPVQAGIARKKWRRCEAEAFVEALVLSTGENVLEHIPLEFRTQRVVGYDLAKEVGSYELVRNGFYERFWRHVPSCWREALSRPKPELDTPCDKDFFFLDTLARGCQQKGDADTLSHIHWTWYDTDMVKDLVSGDGLAAQGQYKALASLPAHMLKFRLCLGAVLANCEAFALCPPKLRNDASFVKKVLKKWPAWHLRSRLPADVLPAAILEGTMDQETKSKNTEIEKLVRDLAETFGLDTQGCEITACESELTAEQRSKAGTISFLLCSKACTTALGVVSVRDGFRDLAKAVSAAVRADEVDLEDVTRVSAVRLESPYKKGFCVFVHCEE